MYYSKLQFLVFYQSPFFKIQNATFQKLDLFQSSGMPEFENLL